MEFLTTIGLIFATASKALELASVRRGKRKEALRQINEQYTALKREVGGEGSKVEAYREFDRIIAEIDRALSTLLDIDKRSAGNSAFWSNADQMNDQLLEAVSVRLTGFNVSSFDDYHKGLLNAQKPTLVNSVQTANALFATQQRDEYVRTLRQARLPLAQMKGFGDQVLLEISRALKGF